MTATGLHAQLASLWEATARKPGNVHRFRDFDDLSYLDFVLSAAAVRQAFDDEGDDSVGALVHRAVAATRRLVRTNTNLGIVLLLAPLVAVPKGSSLRVGVEDVLAQLDRKDTRHVYEAIRLAHPGGLGRVDDQDINDEPTIPLREVMAFAADRDLVARQYANGYREVFDDGLPALERGLGVFGCLEGAILHCHLSLMAKHPDSLIARKCGGTVAAEASRRAAVPLALAGAAGWWAAVADLDAWLRGDGHRRNPGTTADLVTATLFVALRTGVVGVPPDLPWTSSLHFPTCNSSSPSPTADRPAR